MRGGQGRGAGGGDLFRTVERARESTNRATKVISSRRDYRNIIIHFYFYEPMLQSRVALSRCGARCSSVVRAFARGTMGRRVDLSCWTWYVLSCLWDDACKRTLAAAGFLSPYLNGSLPYVRRHITVK